MILKRDFLFKLIVEFNFIIIIKLIKNYYSCYFEFNYCDVFFIEVMKKCVTFSYDIYNFLFFWKDLLKKKFYWLFEGSCKIYKEF